MQLLKDYCQKGRIQASQHHLHQQEMIHYDMEQWQSSQWHKGTRYYSIELCQNLFGEWVVRRSWGGKNTLGAGKFKTDVCKDHTHAKEVYRKQLLHRILRGYEEH